MQHRALRCKQCCMVCTVHLLQAHKDVTPVYLYMTAAQLAARRKAAAEQLTNLRDGAPAPFDASAVRKGRYLGQIEFKRPEGAPGHR